MSATVNAATTKTLIPSPKSLSDLQLFTMPEGGTDKLAFVTWDTIEVLGQGQETIEFRGHYQIERENPTSADWTEASVTIHMRELAVAGVSEKFGRIEVSTNEAYGASGGIVNSGTHYNNAPESPKLCQMDGYMAFHLVDAGLTVFNKDRIRLEHTITHIPPVGQGGGTAPGVSVNLYNVNDPDGEPVAVLHRVKTHIGAWLES